VNNRLEELRNEHAIVEPKEGPVENGDIIKIEYTIEKDGKKIADKKVQELNITPRRR
jgi:trigger factor